MIGDDLKRPGGRIGDGGRTHEQRYTTRVFQQAGKAGIRAARYRGHVSPTAPRRGMGTGVRAAAGLIAPGSRRVIVKARYTRFFGGDLGAARAHLRYIQRDGVTREGTPGRLYDATQDDIDAGAFLERSGKDPYQFRFIISPEDSARLADLKPFVRDLMRQMQRDLDTSLDWVGVDHFNTGHPHTHIVIRGRDGAGRELVMARDYITHGVRARAQGLISLELGPESELERVQRFFNEVGQERLTGLDRSLIARARGGILVLSGGSERDRLQRTLRIGRLRVLERLGLAQQRQGGVWALDGKMEGKLRRLGERADKFKMMQRALKEAGIERGAAGTALFERGARKTSLIGKVVGIGMVDEITDRTWVVVDALDGRAHYAELGRISPADMPARGMLVAIGVGGPHDKPDAFPRLQMLSRVELERLADYDGPTWLDHAIIGNFHIDRAMPGFAAELRESLAARGRWLAERGLADPASAAEPSATPRIMATLRQRETTRMVEALSREFDAAYIPQEPGGRVRGIYERWVTTPTARLAVIRRQDTFTLAPWKPALEPMRGRAVTGFVGPNRVTWTLDRGRGLSGPG